MSDNIRRLQQAPTKQWWNTKYTNRILKLDFAYITSVLQNYFGDNFTITKGEMVCGVFQPKPEFTCEFCGKGRKKNKYTPGSFIKITDEKAIKKYNPDYMLVLPWHFKNFILQKEKKYLDNGGKMIFPLPDIEVV